VLIRPVPTATECRKIISYDKYLAAV